MTLRQQYQRNLKNIEEFMAQPPDFVEPGTKNDPSIEEWKASLEMFEGLSIMFRTGLKLKQEILQQKGKQ